MEYLKQEAFTREHISESYLHHCIIHNSECYFHHCIIHSSECHFHHCNIHISECYFHTASFTFRELFSHCMIRIQIAVIQWEHLHSGWQSYSVRQIEMAHVISSTLVQLTKVTFTSHIAFRKN